jgi:hypothetical protein
MKGIGDLTKESFPIGGGHMKTKLATNRRASFTWVKSHHQSVQKVI